MARTSLCKVNEAFELQERRGMVSTPKRRSADDDEAQRGPALSPTHRRGGQGLCSENRKH